RPHRFLYVEGKAALGPEEDAERGLAELGLQDLFHHLPRQHPRHREDLSQRHARFQVRPVRPEEIRFGEVARLDEQATEVLARIVGGGGDQLPPLDSKTLFVRAAACEKRSGRLFLGEEAKELGAGEEGEAALQRQHVRIFVSSRLCRKMPTCTRRWKG